jgi:hypothetical protein
MSVILRERLAVVSGIKKIFPTCRLKPQRPKNLGLEVNTEISFALKRKKRPCLWIRGILRRPVIVYYIIKFGGGLLRMTDFNTLVSLLIVYKDEGVALGWVCFAPGPVCRYTRTFPPQ